MPTSRYDRFNRVRGNSGDYFRLETFPSISIEELGLNVWTYDDSHTDSTIRTYIKNFRKMLGSNAISTIKGVGYRFN